MNRYYNENVVVQFADLRELVREEVGKLIEAVKAKESTKNQTEKPLSIQQLADRYEVSKATIHNWRKQGLITGFKIGKGRFFHLGEVEENLAQFRYLDALESNGLYKPKLKF